MTAGLFYGLSGEFVRINEVIRIPFILLFGLPGLRALFTARQVLTRRHLRKG